MKGANGMKMSVAIKLRCLSLLWLRQGQSSVRPSGANNTNARAMSRLLELPARQKPRQAAQLSDAIPGDIHPHPLPSSCSTGCMSSKLTPRYSHG